MKHPKYHEETTVTELLFALARLCDGRDLHPHTTFLLMADHASIQTICYERGKGFDSIVFTDAGHGDPEEEPYIDPKAGSDVLNDKTLTDEEEMEEMPRIVSCLGGLLRKVVGADWVNDLCAAIKDEAIE